jgi:hypothetical protein
MMTDLEAKLTRELDQSHQHRALLYWEIYRELSTEFGAARAETLLARAIEARGRIAGAHLFGKLERRDPAGVAAAFLAVSPAEGKLWPHEVERRGDGSVAIHVKRCPLKEAWTGAGLTPEQMATMCRIAGRFDNGCFGESGVAFRATTWQPGHSGCCTLELGAR